MTSSSQTHPGALPPETLPKRLALTPLPTMTAPVNPDIPEHLMVRGPEPVMPQCRTCGDSTGPLQTCPRGLRYQSGAQVMYCKPCLPPSLPVQAAAGVITAAMKSGAATPEEWAQAEADAGILVDPKAAEDIAAAAAEQAHAEDQAEIDERGRQLAAMAGDHRKLTAVVRLLEGRPGTDLLTVAAIAAAAEYGTTPFDHAPMTLTWTGRAEVPDAHTTHRQVVVECVSSYGGRAVLVIEGDDRMALGSLLDEESRDVHARCLTDGCGTVDDYDPALMLGWARLEVAGIEDDRPRWYCSPQCVTAALARAGDELALDDQAAAVDPHDQASALPDGELVDHRYGDPLAYGPTGIPCGCGKPAHSNLVPCQPDESTDTVAEDQDERGDTGEDGAW